MRGPPASGVHPRVRLQKHPAEWLSVRRGFVVVLVFFGLALGGCLGTADEAVDEPTPDVPAYVVQAPDFEFSNVIEPVHDHSDPALHTGAYGLELVAHDPLTAGSPVGVLPGGHTEVSVVEGDDGRWAFVANFGPTRAFSITDVTNPESPVHVADYTPRAFPDVMRIGGGSYWDVAAFPGGDLVVSSAQALGIVDAEVDEYGGGLYLVNTEDKRAPFTESFTRVIDTEAQVPVGIHNARPFWADGAWHVAATTANGQTHIFRVEGDAPARTLAEVSRVVGVHDTTVQVHPLTGQTILYSANGGVFLTDVSDPAAPEELSGVPNGPDLAAYHLIVPSDVLVEGRHFTVSGTETVQGTTPILTVLDTTDPLSPFIVSTWQMPFTADVALPGAYRWSTHNFDVDHGRIYMAHYHGGVWVIDISSLVNAQAPVTMAYYQPHEPVTYVPRTPLGVDVPAVWGTVRHDGLVYAADVNTGLYILRTTIEPSPLEAETTYPHNQR